MAAVRRGLAAIQRREVDVGVIKKAKRRYFKDSVNRLFSSRARQTSPERNFQAALCSESAEGFAKRILKKTECPSLNALTTAALLLPGLLSPSAHAAEGEEVDFQYSHYQEGKRNLTFFGINDDGSMTLTPGKSFNPIEVESVNGHGAFSLTDRLKFAFNYIQDTWGGATPVSTAPAAFGGVQFVRNANNNIVAGASPYTLSGFTLAFDKNLNPYFNDGFDPVSGLPTYQQDNDITHIMSTASPETRKQGDFKLSYEWDETAVSVGGGISIEDDYESRFGNVGLRWDINQKNTTLNLDLSYTNSDTKAVRDHDLYYTADQWYYDHITTNNTTAADTILGNKQDWGVHGGISQVINKSALVSADFNYTRSTGFMSNPYKLTEFFFVDPAEFQFNEFVIPVTAAFFERRPEVRNQWSVGGRYIQYIDPFDAAFHFDYRFSADDWGIQAHTFEADWVQPVGSGWTVTPRIRYYSQNAADFYRPYFVINESYQTKDITVNGETKSVTANQLPSAFSSDQRLSGFGTLSGGVTVAKQFAKGVTLETGFEYYTHQGSFKIGGGGEGDYADFDYWVANAALKVNLEAFSMGGGAGNHAGHADHNHGVHAPAGVMFDHMLPKAGDFMVGYRFMWNSQSGAMLHGTDRVSDQQIVAAGCGGDPCYLTPDSMSMSMHMLDLMYAPTDWLTLMLMPQFVDMDMDMRKLDGAPNLGAIDSILGNHVTHHVQNGHETGGIGDLGMYALFRLFDNGSHHVHATVGLSAPTGDVDIQLRRNHGVDGGFIHYGMQLGSGTWDFKPSLTYTGHTDNWSWGAQASGTVRMEEQNESGYSLGDLFQATAWGSYNLTSWLTASLRGVYTLQGSINGQFTGSGGQFTDPDGLFNGSQGPVSIYKFGPQDYPQNYGGRFWDVGFGLSAMVPSGDLAGNRFSVEWLQPVEDDVNGYQLERDGALSATWSLAF
jgi:hypothetical protein